MKIKSWRVWIEFNDGDWHAETLQSLNVQQRANIETRIKDGYEVWPWPNDGTPTDRVKVTTLKQLHMVSKSKYLVKLTKDYRRNTWIISDGYQFRSR